MTAALKEWPGSIAIDEELYLKFWGSHMYVITILSLYSGLVWMLASLQEGVCVYVCMCVHVCHMWWRAADLKREFNASSHGGVSSSIDRKRFCPATVMLSYTLSVLCMYITSMNYSSYYIYSCCFWGDYVTAIDENICRIVRLLCQ